MAGTFVALAWLYAATIPRQLPLLTGEDGILEWLTVALYATAGVVALRTAVLQRRPFDALIGLFCLVVAGEEMSWGQRLIGFTPPEYFLEANAQQEFNLHNFSRRPRKLFSLVLIGFAVAMPLARLWRPTRRLMDRIGATPPAAALIPWALAAVLLTQWDPRKVTSEWAETLSGAVFLAWTWRTTAASGARRWRALLGAAVASLVLTAVSVAQRPGSGGMALACADAELAALLDDIVHGDAATARLHGARELDKMIWQAQEHGELRVDRAERFAQAGCGDSTDASAHQARRRFAVDPWGVSYWVAVEQTPSSRRVSVYSFGPNRRRDITGGASAGDDIVRTTELPAVAR